MGNRNNKKITLLQRGVLYLVLAACGAFFGGSQTAHAATFEVTNTNNTGAGSLAQAVIDANAIADHDTITFNIPGAGPHVIAPTLLSGLINPTTVDGCTQPGSDCSKFPLVLKIQISAANMLSSANQGVIGFNTSTSSGSIVKGLSITGGAAKLRAGIRLFNHPDNVTIQSNFIGLTPDGTTDANTIGIRTDIFTPHNATATYDNIKIGGDLPGQGNVISGNATFGISFPGGVSNPRPMEGLIIQGNYIGLDPTGTQARPNTTGINLSIMAGAQIGGASPGSTNTIAYNGTGMALGGQLNNTLIQGNKIRNNTGNGITFTNATDAMVGGMAAGQGNEISGNTGKGVAVGANTADTSSGIAVRGNTIFGNGALGIDLANDGVTANGTAGVVRTGPNLLTNFPTIASVAHGSVVVQGNYAGAANQTYTLDFYANDTADPSGNGQGTAWLGAGDVTTNASGNATYSFTFNTNVIPGNFISATATDANGSTSEFSLNQVVPVLPVTPPSVPTPALAETGQDIGIYAVFAKLLIAAGLGVVFRGRILNTLRSFVALIGVRL